MARTLPKKEEDSPEGVAKAESLWTRLPRSRRGYDTAATEALLDELASKHAELESECGVLREQVATLEADLARHRQREQLVSKTLLEATSHATTIRDKAREEAELILRKARAEHEKRVTSAESIERERSDAEEELSRLRGFAQQMQRGLAGFLTQTIEQLRPESEPGASDGRQTGEAEGGIVDALEAARKQESGGSHSDDGDSPLQSSSVGSPPQGS